MNNSTTVLPIFRIYAEALKKRYRTYPSDSALIWLLHIQSTSFQFLITLFSFAGSPKKSEFSNQKFGVFSDKYFLHWFFATELGPRLVGSQKLWGLQVGPVSLLCVFELLIHLNPISHSGLMGIRFLRIIILVIHGRRSRVGKLTPLADETRNGSVTMLSPHTDLQLKGHNCGHTKIVRISPT